MRALTFDGLGFTDNGTSVEINAWAIDASLSALQSNVITTLDTLVAGPNITITGTGTSRTISASGGGGSSLTILADGTIHSDMGEYHDVFNVYVKVELA